jgi:signal transduction histidine kinase
MRRYVWCMQAVWRPWPTDAGTVRDVGVAVAGAALAVLGMGGLGQDPRVLVMLPPLGASLALRRRAPLVMWAILWAVVAVQTVVFGKPPQNVEFIPLLAAGYWLGANVSTRRSVAGLVLAVPVMVVCGHATAEFGGVVLAGPQTAGAPIRADVVLLIIEIVVSWLIGVLVRARKQAASMTARNVALKREAQSAVAAERARIARELHDIVAHHLSVIVLQAAGTRASGAAADAALEKIERSSRQALAETRRLLGVLRDPVFDEEAAGLAPQPGIGELPTLADSVRAAGLPVSLDLRGDHRAVPEAVGVSAYRIVQEALTNVLKHAGSARTRVAVGCADGAVTIEVTDDGAGEAPGAASGAASGAAHAGGNEGGHGLAGMRERAAVFGGELQAGPRPGGGFTVRARLPLGGPS